MLENETRIGIGILRTDSDLTPEQRTEADAADFIAMVVLRNPRFHDSLERHDLNAIFDTTESLEELSGKIKDRFGADTLQLAINTIAQDFGHLEDKPMSPRDEAIRDTVVNWMAQNHDQEIADKLNADQTASSPVTVIEVAEKVRVDAHKKLGEALHHQGLLKTISKARAVFNPSKSGKQRGPGSHTRESRGKLDK